MKVRKVRKRIDCLLVERGLIDNQQKAQAMVMAGNVLVDEQAVTKPGTPIAEDSVIRLKQLQPYVSRGGLKLEGAVKAFQISVAGKTCVDIGSSTGGFTDYLLQHGATRVYAVDVDTNQLDWKIRTDPRVTPVEINARHLEFGNIGELADIVTIDASFISLTMLLSNVPPILHPEGQCVALVKPQFEVSRGDVGEGGIVRDEELQRQVIAKVAAHGEANGLTVIAEQESPITGREGNREFFLLFRKS